jgi:hypothetical protein
MHQVSLLHKQLVEFLYLLLYLQPQIISPEEFTILFFKLLPNWKINLQV